MIKGLPVDARIIYTPLIQMSQGEEVLLLNILEDLQVAIRHARLEAEGYTHPDTIALYTQQAESELKKALALWALLRSLQIEGLGPCPT